MNIREIERVNINISGEKPPPIWIKIIGKSSNPGYCLEKIRAVQKIVAEARTTNWPNDEW